ncbi:MAG TPA: DUF433 domain-containing protein, partial [Actinomycetota bacterium]|nr:DUF433 domain-containing protein [Actinomycetota bacterium]
VITLDSVEAGQIRSALRRPRGRYGAERASQLSGIPKSTLYWWARRGALVPDFAGSEPKNWSYRDLVLSRLMGWLRVLGMPLDASAERVRMVRTGLVSLADEGATVVRSDGRSLLIDPHEADELTGQLLLEGALAFLPSFDLLEPLRATALPAELPKGQTKHWAPNLVRPSDLTRISPWVMGGEPCIVNSRLPTASIWALAQERNLRPEDITALYPEVDIVSVREALDLERKLRAA